MLYSISLSPFYEDILCHYCCGIRCIRKVLFSRNHSAGFGGLAPFFFTVCFLRVDGQSYYFCWKESLLRSGTTFLDNGWRCEKSPWVVAKITATSWFLGTFLRAVITKGDMFPLRSRILRKSYVLRGNA